MANLLSILDIPAELRPEVHVQPGELIEGTEIGNLIAKSARANAARLDDEDQARREQMLAATADKLMAAELETEMARTWPSDEMRERYRQEFKSFRKWCDRFGVGALPAKGSTVACYIADSAADGADKTWFPLAADAIRFVHNACGHHIDGVPIAAALMWAAKLDEQADANDVEPILPTQH